MKRFILKILTFTLVMGILAGCSVFGIRSGYEHLSYTVVEMEPVEVRQYPARLVAEVSHMRDNRDAFMALFGYISGQNERNQPVSMTVPVQVDRAAQEIAMTVPVERSATSADGISMRFFLPQSFTVETAPRPKDPRVQIHMVGEQKFAVLPYTGINTDIRFKEEEARLLELLIKSKWKAQGTASFLGYDPPFAIPFLRRNEVIVPVELR